MKQSIRGEVWSVVIGFLTFVLSTTFFQLFRISGVVFNAGIILVVCTAALWGIKESLISTLTYAVLVDLFASRMLGINFLIYLLLIFVIYKFSEEFYTNSFLLPVILLIGSTVIFHTVYAFFMLVFRALIPMSDLFPRILMELLYNSAVGFMCYYLVFYLKKGFALGREHV